MKTVKRPFMLIKDYRYTTDMDYYLVFIPVSIILMMIFSIIGIPSNQVLMLVYGIFLAYLFTLSIAKTLQKPPILFLIINAILFIGISMGYLLSKVFDVLI